LYQTDAETWKEITHYAGLDWAKEQQQVAVVDQEGRVVAEFRFAHTAEGWGECRQRLQEFPVLAMAIETSQGAAVEKLLESGYTVYPVHPRRAKSYRERKRPGGDKDDALDAWSLADALRVDGAGWKPLAPEDPVLQQLRLLCRDEVALIAQRTALINQLQQALYEYYPAALEAFDDWTHPAAWAFVVTFPTPQVLVAAGRRKWQNFLHAHRLWRPETAPKRLEVFARAEAFRGGEAVSAAKSLLAVTQAKLLRALQTQLEEYRRRIEQLFEQHPDHDLFGSLPGAAVKLAPRLLGEIGGDRDRFADANGLQCLCGTAPVRYESGQCHRVRLRRACNKHLRYAVHLWADLSRARCPWAQAYYAAHRAKGQSHAQALRCLGNRWLKILWKMWQTRTCYDADLHARNQTQHGSWVLQLQPS
jgi:transposase